MKQKRSVNNLLRQALHYAIEEREGWLSSMSDPPSAADAPYVERAKELVADWKALLLRRFGEITANEAYDRLNIPSVPITHVINAEPREFKAPTLRLRVSKDPPHDP